MASTTINQAHLGGVRSAAASVLEVAVSFKNLVAGLLRASTAANAAVSKPLTAFEEAEALRIYAEQFLQSDPSFAEDLFASADRHERAALAR